MKFQVNIEFDSLAEFLSFASYFEQKEPEKTLKLIPNKKKTPVNRSTANGKQKVSQCGQQKLSHLKTLKTRRKNIQKPL